MNQPRSRFSISGHVIVLACPSALVSAAEQTCPLSRGVPVFVEVLVAWTFRMVQDGPVLASTDSELPAELLPIVTLAPAVKVVDSESSLGSPH
jgi:hypothetical protein